MIISLCDKYHTIFTVWKQTQKKSLLFFCFCLKTFNSNKTLNHMASKHCSILCGKIFLRVFGKELPTVASTLCNQTLRRTKHHRRMYHLFSQYLTLHSNIFPREPHILQFVFLII